MQVGDEAIGLEDPLRQQVLGGGASHLSGVAEDVDKIACAFAEQRLVIDVERDRRDGDPSKLFRAVLGRRQRVDDAIDLPFGE